MSATATGAASRAESTAAQWPGPAPAGPLTPQPLIPQPAPPRTPTPDTTRLAPVPPGEPWTDDPYSHALRTGRGPLYLRR
ncbi:hypothetical protein ACWDAZ_34535, partial [Streptomyces sp. NPDC001215]